MLQSLGIYANSIEFWGTGAALREFMFVDDLADACLYFMENISAKNTGDFVNVGTGVEISIKDTINIIANIIGYQGKIEFDVRKPDGTPRKLMDSTKASELGWQSKYNFEESLNAVIDNYVTHINQ
ncbi:GDP-L-fucose synthase [bioreactor metagenome]|uniref:GDP-L-fucose synthase n=1 Tax=bioreactor metagenome TaxID=1076179 RepID=A0A645A2Q2_9ZZZZ